MYPTPLQIDHIRSTAHELLGESERVTLFGSRVRDDLKGGDVNLIVDVVLKAPNLLQQPIHDIARQTGILL